jgi:hypothetical protein
MPAPTERQIEDAKLHATAWEEAWSALINYEQDGLARRDDVGAVKLLAMSVAGGYRRIANGGEIED